MTGFGSSTGGDKKQINRDVITVVGETGSNQFRYSYEVESEAEGRVVLNLYSNHSCYAQLEKGHRYEVTNIELERGTGQSLFQSTPETSVTDMTDSGNSANLLLTGDTHVGFYHRKVSDRHPYDAKSGISGFKRIVDYGTENDVDVIIHTGDLFDHDATKRDCEWVEKGLRVLDANCVEFAFVRGNHDEYGLTSTLETYANVRHVGDGEPIHFAGFTLLGYDANSLTNLKNLPLRKKIQSYDNTVFCIVHPQEPDFDRDEIESSLDEVPTPCYLFVGHHHSSKQYQIGNVNVTFTGTPREKSSVRQATAWQVQATNGRCEIEKIYF